MADETKDDDQLGNFKAEVNRKIDNQREEYTAQLKETNDQFNKILSDLNESIKEQPQQTAPTPTAQESGLDDLWYSDPNKAAELIQQQTEEKIMRKVEAQQAQQQKQTTVISNLISDYPELNDPNHELTKQAVKNYGEMEATEQASPLAYKVAAIQAAQDLGVVPRKKRAEDNDANFSLSSSRAPGARSDKASTNQQDDLMLQFAQQMKLDVSDDKVVERLKNRSQRDFSRYQGVK